MEFNLNMWIGLGVMILALVIIGFMVARLYRRSTKEVSFVRTGFRGEKVIMNGGAMVLPILQEIIPVNMNTLRLEVKRAADQALITRDRMRVDVMAEFYVRVKPTSESIATAAQTLGQKTMSPNELKELVEGKFVDALRAVALPAVEVHISDPEKREPYRHVSYTGMACRKVIKGKGLAGYREAILYLKELAEK